MGLVRAVPPDYPVLFQFSADVQVDTRQRYAITPATFISAGFGTLVDWRNADNARPNDAVAIAGRRPFRMENSCPRNTLAAINNPCSTRVIYEVMQYEAHAPRCGGPMKIVSFIEPTRPDVIDRILTHCGLADELPRTPPQAPRPEIRQLQYVTDIEFVRDAGPAEPVWSCTG